MRRRLLRVLFRLASRRTRRRFGEEFDALLDELIEHKEWRWSQLLGDTFGAVLRDRAADTVFLRWIAGVLAALSGLVFLLSGPSLALSASSVHRGPVAGPLSRPVDVPVGPQTSLLACPDPAFVSAPLPSGAVLSSPSLDRQTAGVLSAAGNSFRYGSDCSYTLTIAASMFERWSFSKANR